MKFRTAQVLQWRNEVDFKSTRSTSVKKGEIILICKQFFLLIQPRCVPTTLKFLKSLHSVEYLEVERLQKDEYRFKMGLQKLIIF